MSAPATARVSGEFRHLYRVLAEHGELLAEVSGKLRHEADARGDFPVVGDWVEIEARPAEGRATIHAILPRRSKFSRKAAGRTTREQVIAANVDTVLLVTSLDHDFSPRRIERYLAMARESGALPVVVLNKADLCGDVEDKIASVEGVAPGVSVLAISALESRGLDALAPYLRPGQTVALLGSSGVGKSTIINRLLGSDRMATREVREADSKGRHTTSYRQLLPLASGAMVIDTPGMRELQLWDADDGVRETFGDLETLASGCRFADCTHVHEPGCAVLAAVESGTFDAGRLASFHKLQAELRYLNLREDVLAQQEQKRKWKAIHKAARHGKPGR